MSQKRKKKKNNKNPGKQKRKLTPAEKAARRKRRAEYMTIFINGKQKSVKRPPTIDGIPQDEWIQKNADPIWLQQNGYYEILYQRELEEQETAFPEDNDAAPNDDLHQDDIQL